MTRFQATIEFSLDWDASIEDAKSKLEDCLHDCEPLVIKSIVKTSITHQEALKQIQELLDETAAYGNVSSEAVKYILNKVAQND
jgi:predicted naringenin-chalcone synthase